jgi:hypothetical protein
MPEALTLILLYGNICLFPIPDASFDTCIGYAKSKGRRCHNPIAKAVRASNKAQILELTESGVDGQGLDTVLARNLLCKRNHSDQTFTIQGALMKALDILTATHTPVCPSVTSPEPEQCAIRISTNGSNPPEASTTLLAPLTNIQRQLLTSGGRFTFYPRECTIKQAEEFYEKLKETPLTPKRDESGFIYVYRHQDVEGMVKIRYCTISIH